MPDINNLPNPEDLTDEELDTLLETGQLPETKEDDNKGDDDAKDDDTSQDEDKGDESEEDKLEDKPAPTEDDKPDEDEDKPEDKPTDDKKPSRREQARVRDLLEKYGKPDDSNKPQPKKADGIDYSEALDADDDTLKRFADDRQAAHDSGFTEGLEQMNSVQFLTNLKIDAPRVEAKYPQLDKNSDDFKPEAASDFNLLFLNMAGYDSETRKVKHPDFSYEMFADSIFGLANELADTKVEEATKVVKKQAAQTGLRPDGSGAKKLDLTKAPQDMSDEELDAYLSQAIPQR